MRKFCDLGLERFKVIHGQRSWRQSIAHGRLPVRLLLIPTSYLSLFLKYLTCNSDELKLGQFKVIQGQKSWCQSMAQGRFHIRLPLTLLWYLSPFSRYLTLKLFCHRMQAERELDRKYIEALPRSLVPVLLAIELALLCQMCDLRFKVEEDRTKTAALSRAIGTRSDRHTLQVILYPVQCHELHWTGIIYNATG